MVRRPMSARMKMEAGPVAPALRFLLALVVSLAALAPLSACGRDGSEPASADEGISVAGREAHGSFSTRSGLAVTGGVELAAEEGGEEEDDESSKDYWKDIRFDRANFEEVRQRVRKAYIDPGYDEAWGYAQAAGFALASNDKRLVLIYPESFYEARKDHADEKGGLKGAMFKLSPTDKFVLLEESKEKVEEPKRRLSEDEIRALRDKSMDRTRKLHEAWKAAGFTGRDFDRVMGFIQRELPTHDGWSMKNAWVSAAQGYLYSLDPHSSLISKAAWDDSTRKTQDSSFEGIGAILTQRPDSEYTIVESPIQGQPAVKAGVRAGDMIVEVDGKDVKGESLSKVVSRIRGPAGSTVVLTVSREGEPEPKKIAIKRSTIEMRNVQGRMLEHHEGVGYIKVTGYIRSTDDDFMKEYRRLESEAPGGRLRGLVLDLRNNSGGLLNQGIRMADHFLPAGRTIVSVRNRNSADDEVYRSTGGDILDVPMVVLVNDGSASAAEIVASALQDNQRALVIGDRTFGKASVQTLFSPLLQDDYYIKLTVARYYSPSGRTLQVTGVIPDVVAPPEADGKMPLGFREENLSGHLVPLDGTYDSPNKGAAQLAAACADAAGKAKKIVAADPNPAVKFDWQLMYGADLLGCAGDLTKTAGKQR